MQDFHHNFLVLQVLWQEICIFAPSNKLKEPIISIHIQTYPKNQQNNLTNIVTLKASVFS